MIIVINVNQSPFRRSLLKKTNNCITNNIEMYHDEINNKGN